MEYDLGVLEVTHKAVPTYATVKAEYSLNSYTDCMASDT
jgi:hypothetical protein